MVNMSMGNEKTINRFMIVIPAIKPLNVGKQLLTDKFRARETLVLFEIKSASVFIDNWHPDINNNPAVTVFYLDTGTADFVGAAMDFKLHVKP